MSSEKQLTGNTLDLLRSFLASKQSFPTKGLSFARSRQKGQHMNKRWECYHTLYP